MIGILGGMGTQAGLDFCNKLAVLNRGKIDQEYPLFLLYNKSNIPGRPESIGSQTKNLSNKSTNKKSRIKYERVLKSLLKGCKLLERNKCKFIVIPCNTAHYWYDDLQKKINIPIINMPKEVFKFTKKNCKKNSKVGLLATEGTLKTGVYNNYFDKNYSLIIPPENIQKNSVNKAIKFAKTRKIQINNVEGFVRQIIGWREFIKNVYDYHDSSMKKSNFWGHKLKLKKSWYDGSTGIEPLDHAIKEVNKFGYAHHIIRLMLISNIMNLSGIDPKEIFKWFMEMFIDSSDWVMTPNVFGMGTFSDGGIFATKPYICGSNYLLKMSDYKRGEWCEVVDGLYWQFIEKNKKYIKSNHRLSMMAYSLEKIDPERKKRIFTQANKFIKYNTY